MATLDSPLTQEALGGDQNQQSAPVPVEKEVNPPQPGQYGPNNEFLEIGTPLDPQEAAKYGVQPGIPGRPELTGALRKLVLAYRQEGMYGRRLEIRRIRQARLFWQELQYGWFDPFSMNWRLPGPSGTGMTAGADQDQQDGGRYQFCTNFYQAFGLSFISVISQDVPSVEFYPQSVDEDQDITAAKAATDATELIELNNHVSEMLTGVGWLLWTDGKIGSYTRYVADGERFGFTEMDEMQEGQAPLGEDVYQCAECGTETPAESLPLGGLCPNCGGALDDDNLKPAEMVSVPRSVGTQKLPKGQEVISIVGGLELNTPINVNEIWDMPWLQWQMEAHQAKLKSAYPHVRDRIGAGHIGQEGADDTYARITRLAVAQGMPILHPGDTLNKYATFVRTWLRPWALEELDDKVIREQLKQLFPDGGFAAFVGDTYCESRNENMLDKWRVMHAYPGDGQSRPSVGNSMIQVQERYNAISNIEMEQWEFGIPPIYADPQVLDFNALTQQEALPAAHYPARARPGQALENSFYQPNAPVVGKEMMEYQQELVGPIAQMLTGLFPAVYGGSMDDVKTASAYAQARDQALGRLGLVWRRLKEFYAQTMMLAVDCFRQNRPEDAQIPMKGQNGQFEAKYIRLMDLKGNIQARAEADETFPRLKSQQKAVLQQFMAVDSPVIEKFFSNAKNLQLIKGIFGLNEFSIPDEDGRKEQLREIDEMLQPGAMPQPDIDPMSGQPTMISTVPIDSIMDDNEAHFETCKEWWASDKGQEARQTNPQGAMNVRAHALAHFKAMVMNAAPAPMPAAPGGKPGGGGPTSEEPPGAPMPEPAQPSL